MRTLNEKSEKFKPEALRHADKMKSTPDAKLEALRNAGMIDAAKNGKRSNNSRHEDLNKEKQSQELQTF
jgi:hypothetical protein